ncbi:MAG: hypothetical protein J6N52_08080 [Clostridia bacterium]|nr:hypothetical protein [Clostridia bacterium]
MKKYISILILSAMMITMIPYGVSAENEFEVYEQVDYNSNSFESYNAFDYMNFSENSGVWKWQYCEKGKYIDLDTISKAQYFDENGTSASVNVWTAKTAGGGMLAMNEYYMRAGYNKNAIDQQYAVKTFTSPYSGIVRIDGSVYSDVKFPNANIKIMKNNEQVWPASGSYEGVEGRPETVDTYVVTNDVLSFKDENIYLTVNEGDTVHFVLLNGRRTTTNHWQYTKIRWETIVKYVAFDVSGLDYGSVHSGSYFSFAVESVPAEFDESSIEVSTESATAPMPYVEEASYDGNIIKFRFSDFEEGANYIVKLDCLFGITFRFTAFKMPVLPSYRASDSFSTEENNGEIWRWQMYDELAKEYIDMPYVINYVSGFSDDGTKNGTAWGATTNAGPVVGKYKMRPNVSENESDKIRVVRSFAAPYDGKLRLAADDGQGGSRILGCSTSNMGACLCVKKNNLKIWPDKGDFARMTTQNYIDFNVEDIDVKTGDVIHFEVFIGGYPSMLWQKTTYWDPVVEYSELYPDVLSGFDGNSSSRFSMNKPLSVSFSEQIAPIEVSDVFIEGAAVSSVEMLDNDTRINIYFSGLHEFTEYRAVIKDVKPYYAFGEYDNGIEFSFVTGPYIEVDKFYVSEGLKPGTNTIRANVNNTGDYGVPLTVIAAVCEGSESDYTIKSVWSKTFESIVKDSTIDMDVNLAEISDKIFLKVMAVDGLENSKPISEMNIVR